MPNRLSGTISCFLFHKNRFILVITAGLFPCLRCSMSVWCHLLIELKVFESRKSSGKHHQTSIMLNGFHDFHFFYYLRCLTASLCLV